MLFSVIIPTYNRAHIITETLLSVLDQSFSNYEIIVVDDGSEDNTREVVEKINNEKIRYFYKPNEERSVARNYGADKAVGEYLIFLDSDDKIQHDHLALARHYLISQREKVRVLFSGYVIFNPDGSKLYEYTEDGIFDQKKLFYGNFLGCSSVIIEKDLFTQYYFNTDPRLILFEDWELWLRINAHHQVHCIPIKSVIMVNHNGRSVLNYDYKQLMEKILFFKNYVLSNVKTISDSFVNKRTFLMGVYSYASLHIALTKKSPVAALKYLLKSVGNNPSLIFKRRFFGILKQLF